MTAQTEAVACGAFSKNKKMPRRRNNRNKHLNPELQKMITAQKPIEDLLVYAHKQQNRWLISNFIREVMNVYPQVQNVHICFQLLHKKDSQSIARNITQKLMSQIRIPCEKSLQNHRRKLRDAFVHCARKQAQSS